MIIILLVLLLLSLLLFYCTHSINIKEGIDSSNADNNSIDTVNYTLDESPNFLNKQTSANIDDVTSRLKDYGDIKKLVLQSQAELASITADVNNLVTIEKIVPKNTTGVASLTQQVNSLAPLVQKVKDVSSIINNNSKLLGKVGKHIQQMGLTAAIPDGKTSPPPKGTGSVWPPPGGLPHR
jgi:hypothetical protein